MNTKSRRLLRLISAGVQIGIALVLSLVITIVNSGFTPNFAQDWIKGFIVAMIIIPPALRLIPYVANGARMILGDRSLFAIRCAVALCFATLMEGMISLAITLAQYGLAPGWLAVWGTAFVKALPVGLVIGFSMTFLVQPYMMRIAIANHPATHAGRGA